MDRRIFGLENEYGVTCTFRGQRRLSPDEVARYLFRRVVSWGRSSNVFLENGARLYLDVGSHPEYATPECDDIRQLVAHDKAGERILESLVNSAEARLREEGIAGQVYLFKNNTDSAGNSYGCHENSLVSRYGEFGRLEEGTVMRDLSLENPIRAIREISHDLTCRRKVRLANGREASAIELQWEYLSRAAKYVERRDDPEMKEAVRAWEECLVALEDDFLALDHKIDWVMKYRLIERYRERHGITLGNPKLALMDLVYHDVSRRRGLYYMLERNGLAERAVSEEDVRMAMHEAPQTTRAKLRGEFIRAAKRRRRDYTVDWVHLKLNDQAQRTVLCKDPFKYTDERVAKLIAWL